MNATFDAFVCSWPFEPWLSAALALVAGLYLRGWRLLNARNALRWSPIRPVAFLGGLGVLFLALASPIEPFGALLLQVHMLQHLLLMMVAPPLLWLGEPLFPLLMGLPGAIRAYWAAPLLHSPDVRRIGRKLTHPVVAWVLFAAAVWFWHLPQTYELALRSDAWHYVEHAFFLGSALCFWYPVIRPFPARPTWSPWLLIPYLILADVQNTLLSAVLTFADQPLYAYYAERPRLGNLSPLDDQATAGVLMWVPGSAVFLVPLFVITVRLLFGGGERSERRSKAPVRNRAALHADLPIIGQPRPSAAPVAFDLLRTPLIGRFLRWRHARLSLQLPLLFLAALIVYDGLCGPAIGAKNLAGVLPWVHWRGFVVLGLLSAGNVVCMACPFMLPRNLARRIGPARRAWPAWLRNKWLSLVLLAVFLWAYEAFALWDSPWWTAWIILAYFTAALVIDGFFRGASFCKYVCPIGQFNFVHSLLSPWEIKVRAPDVCVSCQTKDCIRGRDGIPGCELHLYQPRKSSNMDCTFCLDCICACPHDNIGLLTQLPGNDLWSDRLRSGIGRFSKRHDMAGLIVVLVFGAFVNAAGMVGPVQDWRERLTHGMGSPPALLMTTFFYVFGLIIGPGLLLAAAAAASRWLGGLHASCLEVANRFSFALLPIGLGMWLAHYSFHMLASFDAGAAVVQRFAGDLGWTILGEPQWARDCCVPVADWLLKLEILFLDLGLLCSLYAGYRVALGQSDRGDRVLRILAPWALLIAGLFVLGIWIVFQPMQMRGTLSAAG
jgi:cytochrome c oxidase assembly factor CtaG/polyferredoxin